MSSAEDSTPADELTSRQYPERPFASIAACVLKDNKILVIKRAKPPSQGLWSVPGGVIELGETIQQAIIRELSEECDIEIEPGRIFNVENGIVPDEDGRILFHYVVTYMLARHVGGEPRAGSDALAVMWATPEELAGLDMNPAVRRNMVEAFRVAGMAD